MKIEDMLVEMQRRAREQRAYADWFAGRARHYRRLRAAAAIGFLIATGNVATTLCGHPRDWLAALSWIYNVAIIAALALAWRTDRKGPPRQ